MIRIIHTSDWHIGLELNGHNRLEEQMHFLTWLLGQCIENRIDALLIAGDIFDVTNPSIEAQTLLSKFVIDFKTNLPKASLVIIGGNHDSGSRMEISRAYGQALGNIHVVGSLDHKDSNLISKHIIPLYNLEGQQAAWCLAIPFLRASDLDCRLKENESPDQAFSRSIAEIYSQLRLEAQSLIPNLPLIAMGHLTAMGSEKSGSERMLIGGVDSVPVNSISKGMDYVALGHIHKGQAISVKDGDVVDKNKVQYCGSPLTMDFAEREYQHRILLVELDIAGSVPKITPISIPQTVDFIFFSKPLKSWDLVEAEIMNYDWSKWKSTPKNMHPFVDIQFLSEGGLGDLRAKTDALVKQFPFRLVRSPQRLSHESEETPITKKQNLSEIDLRSEKSPLNVFEAYFNKKHNQQLSEELKVCFDEILTVVSITGERK